MTSATIGVTGVSFVPDEAMLRRIRERDKPLLIAPGLTTTGRPTVSKPFLLDELAAVLLAC